MVRHASHVHRPGDPALLRYVWRDWVAQAWPVTVVEDTDERTAMFVRAGTPIRWIVDDIDPAGVETEDRVWVDTNALLTVQRDRWSSIWPMWWAASGDFLCWYVNLQTPLERTALGWDTVDLELDVVVWPDRRCEWKDEEAFARKVERGLFTPEQADAARREGERVIADAGAERYPFDRDWSSWRPEPSWPVDLALPDGWDVR